MAMKPNQPKLTIGQVQAQKAAAAAKAKNDARIASNRARGTAMQAAATARAAKPSQPKQTVGQAQAAKALAQRPMPSAPAQRPMPAAPSNPAMMKKGGKAKGKK